MATESPPGQGDPDVKMQKRAFLGCENGHISSFKLCKSPFLAHLVKQPINNETADHVAICVCISHSTSNVIFSDYNRIMCPR